MKLVPILEAQIYDLVGPLVKQAYQAIHAGGNPMKELKKLKKIQRKLAEMGHPAAQMVAEFLQDLGGGYMPQDQFSRAALGLK